MICILDSITDQSVDFVQSLKSAGIDCPIISCQDDGHLPDWIESPFTYFTQDDVINGYPKYFNQVPIPKLWEIRGTNQSAEVVTNNVKKANIFYRQPTHERYVRAAEWFDVQGVIRVAELYNKNGRLFSKIAYAYDQTPLQRVYLNQQNEVVIIENYQLNAIRLYHNNRWHHFSSKEAFMHYYVQQKQYSTEQVFYNSLSTPFFYALSQLGDSQENQHDVLFWQEEIVDQLPGNMQVLLDSKKRNTVIAVDNKQTFERIMQIAPQKYHHCFKQAGYVYRYQRLNNLNPEALILTNSHDIEQLETIVEQLPNVRIHIGALTEMSSKLMAFAQYANVSLYPNIRLDKVIELFQHCDVYLDINYAGEILNAVREAFNHNMLIVAFSATCHNKRFVANDHRFDTSQVHELIKLVNDTLQNSQLMESALGKQKHHADEMSAQAFRHLIAGREHV